MDIGSGTGYPSSALSNFSPHPFVFRGKKIASMEGFLQGLKFKSPEMQLHVFTLVGKKAKFKGKPKKWWTEQTLWFQGKPYLRHTEDYQMLLDEAFECLFKNTKARKALLATGKAVLTHSLGRSDMTKTVLTEREFVSRLTRIRRQINEDETRPG